MTDNADEEPLAEQLEPTPLDPEGGEWLDEPHGHHHHMTDAEQRLMASYESLDYDMPTNALYRKDRMSLDQRVNSWTNIARWVVFALIGILTGTLAFALSWAVNGLSDWKFGLIRDRVHDGELLVPYLILLGVTLLFVLIASFLVAVVEPVSGGSGIPEIKAYLNGTNYLRFLRLKTLLCKAVGVVFSVSGGLAIGKEGPLVHSGAIFAANISHLTTCGRCATGRWRRWVYQFRNDRDKRDFVSGGAAAGVAAAFGAPVGGILFSLEEASSFWSIDLTWRVFLCSMLGTFFLTIWKLVQTGNEVFSGLISFGPPLQGTPYRIQETIAFILLAMFGGLMGAAFNYINSLICHWRRDVLAGRPLPRMLEVCIVGIITATCVFWAPYFVPRCRPIPAADQRTMEKLGETFLLRYRCPEGEYSTMASMLFTTTEVAIRGFFHNEAYYDWDALLIYFVIIFFLAVVTYGIAVPSGLFVPCILMGCAFGRLLGEGMRYAFPDVGIVPGTYALMGATASLGGVARMTISLAVILLETTNDIGFVVPIMLLLMVSKWVGDLFNISLYDLHVELKCFPFVESAPSGNMFHLAAADIMQHPVVSLRRRERVSTVIKTLQSCAHNGFPVVTTTAPHRYVGIILRNHLNVLIAKRAFGNPEDALPRVHYDDFSTSLSSKHVPLRVDHLEDGDLDRKMRLDTFMNPAPVSVQLECPLSRVFVLFRSLGIRHLCVRVLVVVDKDNLVQGIITRKEIMSSFDQDLF